APDLTSAILIRNLPPSRWPHRPTAGWGPASLVVGTASKESVDATVRETVRLKYECGATDRAIARHRAQYGCVHLGARCRGEASLAAASDTDGPSAGSDSVSQRRPAARFASQGPEPDWTRVHRELSARPPSASAASLATADSPICGTAR